MLGGWQQPSRKIDKDHNLADESWNKPLFVDYFTSRAGVKDIQYMMRLRKIILSPHSVGRKIQYNK
jgi:hypothetical protein